MDNANQSKPQAKKASRWEQDFIAAVLDTISALVVVLDLEGRIVRFNRACEQVTGYPFEEVRGKRFWDLFLVAEEVDAVKTVFEELMAGNFPNEHENHWLAQDGRRRLIAWSNTVLLDDEGQVEYVIGTGIDITEHDQVEQELRRHRDHLEELVRQRTTELEREILERKQAEEALQAAYEELSATLNALPDLLFEIDRLGQIHDFRAPHSDPFYLAPQEFLGQTVDQVLPKEAARTIMDALGQAVEWGRYSGAIYSSGVPTGAGWFELSLAAKGDSRAPNAHFIALARDITNRKRAEEEREKLILELEDALDKVKQLRGLLPICASCKKIRDDQGYWTQVEVYVGKHSEAEFSHGICPDCYTELYPPEKYPYLYEDDE